MCLCVSGCHVAATTSVELHTSASVLLFVSVCIFCRYVLYDFRSETDGELLCKSWFN